MGFTQDQRFYSILETRKGAYRGNHIHPYAQYTLLISGKGRYVRQDGSVTTELPLERGKVLKVEAGIPHIMVPEEDCVTFEWWDGEFVDEPCRPDTFDVLTSTRVGPDKLRKKT